MLTASAPATGPGQRGAGERLAAINLSLVVNNCQLAAAAYLVLVGGVARAVARARQLLLHLSVIGGRSPVVSRRPSVPGRAGLVTQARKPSG